MLKDKAGTFPDFLIQTGVLVILRRVFRKLVSRFIGI